MDWGNLKRIKPSRSRGTPWAHFQVAITHALHVCSQYSFRLPLKMYGMYRTHFDHARLDFLSLVIWSRVFWPSVTWNLRKAQRWSKSALTFALRNLWLLLGTTSICWTETEIRNVWRNIESDHVRNSCTILWLTHEDPHTTFFCTPHDAGVVKDARFWVTSNKPPTAKSN